MNASDYISENEKRRAALHEEYDPIVGLGSPIERVELPLGATFVTNLGTPCDRYLIPAAMAEAMPDLPYIQEHGYSAYCKNELGISFEEGESILNKLRLQYDFEFWCAVRARIKNKTGEVVPFVLNRPQRKYLADLEKQRLSGEPVRQIVLKHRQWGCTTMSYTYVAWHQIELYKGRDAWFVGRDQDGARDVIERYDMIRQSTGITLRNYGGSDKTKQLVERDCYVAAGSVERPNAPSGRPAQFVHLFEIGKWPSNPSVSAEKVAQNVGAMLVDEPGTVEIIESTAQASTGTYFMEICQKAQLGQSAYAFLFVSWLDDPQYTKPVQDVERFLGQWGDSVVGEEYCNMLWDLGATLEQINWYIVQAKRPEYSDRWRLMEEFPTTAEEAFQHGGKRVFPAAHVHTARKTCKEPVKRGNLAAASRKGEGAFTDIRFEEDPRGPLVIWRMPEDNYNGLLTHEVGSRFVIGADIGPGQWDGADFNCAFCLDRAPLLFGGMPEAAAEWHGHLDADLFAWEAARLALWYSRAYLAVEVNSLIEDNETRYDPGQTVLDEIIPYYGNLHRREVYDEAEQRITKKVGFHMNSQTKALAIDSLKTALREHYLRTEGEEETYDGYIERCLAATNEMDIYMIHDDGSMGSTSRAERSSKSKKDDRIIARAIALAVQSDLPPPSYIKKQPPRRRAAGMANF